MPGNATPTTFMIVLGSGGWILAGLLIGTLRLEATGTPMRLAAAASLLMGGYCFTLPDTPPLAKTERLSLASVFPREALNLVRERSMLVFAIASFLICIPLQFYYAFTFFLTSLFIELMDEELGTRPNSRLLGQVL